VPEFKQSQSDHDKHTLECINSEHPEKIALIEYLHGMNFDTFGTFTTAKPMGIYAARRKMQHVANYIGAGISTDFFWCAEKFDVREGFHTHGLINWNLPDTKSSNQMLFDHWQGKYGTWNKDRTQWIKARISLDPIRGNYNAEYYVTKYITKSITDYDYHITKETSYNAATYVPGAKGTRPAILH